jgi:hypothetical protein
MSLEVKELSISIDSKLIGKSAKKVPKNTENDETKDIDNSKVVINSKKNVVDPCFSSMFKAFKA